MRLYEVTLISRDDSAMQVIAVQSEHSGEMQEFVDRIEDLAITNPAVVAINDVTGKKKVVVNTQSS